MTYKQLFMRLVCAGELLIIVWFLCCGSQGIMALMRQHKKLSLVEKAVQVQKSELAALEYEYEQWKNDPFYLEKQAREKLAMSREGEIIFSTKRS